MHQDASPPSVPLPLQHARWAFEALDARPVRRWLDEQAPRLGYRVALLRSDETTDSWFDTPDWRFHRAGLALRVQVHGSDRVVETLALRDDAHALEPARCAISAQESLKLGECTGRVGERVRSLTGGENGLDARLELRTRCESWLIGREGGPDVAELHLIDARAPSVAGRARPVELTRVEVHDLPESETPALTEFVELLRVECRLLPGGSSLFESALFLMGEGPAPLPDLGPTELAPDPTVGEVALAVLRRHFGAVLRHEPGTRLGEDIEALHDMRVATRRMRAALRVFSGVLPPRVLALRPGLQWLGTALGEVRDLDVGLEQLDSLRHSLEEDDAHALDFIETRTRKQRDAARKRMLRSLDSKRYARLVERVGRVLRQGPGRARGPWREPAALAAPPLVVAARRRVVKPGGKIDDASPDADLHRLRIRCKRYRYTMEFLEELYRDPARRMIRRVVALQDLLGEHQDAAVAIDRLRAMVDRDGRKLPPHTVFVIGRLAERYAQRKQALRAAWARTFRSIRGKPWRRLRQAMQSAAVEARVRALGPNPPPPAPAST